MSQNRNVAVGASVVIVGAGLIGSSVAMHLAELGYGSVTVLDLDLDGAYSSSELNAGGVRATWNHPVNAQISKLSIDYFKSIADDIGFRQNGYFWMYPKSNWILAKQRLSANEGLKKLGIEFLSPDQIQERYPFIDKVEDLGGATFSPFDGLLNANLLKMHFRERAKKAGARFINRTWVHSVKAQQKPIQLNAWQWPNNLSDDEMMQILTTEKNSIKPAGANALEIRADLLINCSGAWARRFARSMSAECNSIAVRRQVSIFECREVDLTDYGMFVDASGVYFHAEATNILGGFAVDDEPTGYNFEYDGEAFFERHIWPALYERSTKFENLKHVTGWAGLYEVSPDHSGIVGPVSGFENVFEAHSFSGRGAMQSYAIGLGLAERIANGAYGQLDLSALDGGRFARGESVAENLLI